MDSFELRNIINEIMDKKNLDLSGIAEKSKANRSYLSKVINSKESMQVGPKVAGKIARAFPEHWPGNNTNNNPPKGHYFTADQLFHMYMKAMEKQDGIMERQMVILESIRKEMAREETQAKIEANSIETLAGVLSLSKRQKQAIAEFRKDLSELKSQHSQPRGSGRKSRESDGAGEKRDRT